MPTYIHAAANCSEMFKETDFGIAYLTALKTNRAGSSAPQPDALTAGPEIKTAVGSEKRRSRRFNCEGSAEIRTEGSGLRTWATFTDISLHGCYVEAQTTYATGTVLNLKLDLDGIQIESHGVVRVSYPGLGMGIAFVSPNPHNTAELRRLLAGLARPTTIMGSSSAPLVPSSIALDNATAGASSAKALQALTEFFASRQMMTRDDFQRIVRESQKKIQAED